MNIIIFLDVLLLSLYGYIQWLHIGHLIGSWNTNDGAEGQRLAFSLYNIYFFIAVLITFAADLNMIKWIVALLMIRVLFILCGLTTMATYRGSSFRFFTKDFWKEKLENHGFKRKQ